MYKLEVLACRATIHHVYLPLLNQCPSLVYRIQSPLIAAEVVAMPLLYSVLVGVR